MTVPSNGTRRVSMNVLAVDALGLLRDIPELAGVVAAYPALDLRHARRVAGSDLPAIAARCAPADTLRFEDDHAVAALRKIQRRRKTGISGADNADVHLDRTRQLGAIRHANGGGGVVGVDVLAQRQSGFPFPDHYGPISCRRPLEGQAQHRYGLAGPELLRHSLLLPGGSDRKEFAIDGFDGSIGCGAASPRRC